MDPRLAIGLAGELGPYQITRAYWEDAIQHNPLIGGTFEDVKGYTYGQRIIGSYMDRYVPYAWIEGDFITCSRIHHGGPRGMEREHTLRYAFGVLDLMQQRTESLTLKLDIHDKESTRDRAGSTTLLGR